MDTQSLFHSPEYAAYLTDLAETVSGQYDRVPTITTDWDESDKAVIAYTDGQTIYINLGNPFTARLQDTAQKSLSYVGLLAHELGHILYTDFPAINKAVAEMREGRYPLPTTAGLSPEEQQMLPNVQAGLSSSLRRTVYARQFHRIWNCLEDVYIEACICTAFPGTLKSGILLNGQLLLKSALSTKEEIRRNHSGFTILHNLILQYARSRKVKAGAYRGEFLDVLEECKPLIEIAVTQFHADRVTTAARIFIHLWPWVQHEQDILSCKLRQLGMGLIPQGKSNAVKAGQVVDKSSAIPVCGKAFSPDDIADKKAIGRLSMQVAERKVLDALDRELSDELNRERKSISFGDLHEQTPLTIERPPIRPEWISAYQAQATPLLPISQAIGKRLIQLLRDRQAGGKITGLPMGKQLDQNAFYRMDGGIFCNKKLPTEPQSLAVALLLDCSGSMSGERLQAAQNTAIILQDFCFTLRIPILIYGHRTTDSSVALSALTEFDTPDDRDRYRLMAMYAGGCNRDGMALRYIRERLSRRPEDRKLLMLVSDGAPNDGSYFGKTAETDLQTFCKECRTKKIHLISAAIGEDKPEIERIYGSGFLDISNLEQLPQKLLRHVVKYLTL